MTFIDHESRIIWNGSQLDRNLSANVFNDWWNNGIKPELKIQDSPVSNTNTIDHQQTKDLFEFISQEYSPNTDLGLFSLLSDAQARIMKKNSLLIGGRRKAENYNNSKAMENLSKLANELHPVLLIIFFRCVFIV